MDDVAVVTDDEWESLARLPLRELLELSADLDLLAPAEIDGRELIDQCVPVLCEWIKEHGLPVSKYDREELESLSKGHLYALGRLTGLEKVSVPRLIRDGTRLANKLGKIRQYEAVVMMLPMLLTAIARYVDERD